MARREERRKQSTVRHRDSDRLLTEEIDDGRWRRRVSIGYRGYRVQRVQRTKRVERASAMSSVYSLVSTL